MSRAAPDRAPGLPQACQPRGSLFGPIFRSVKRKTLPSPRELQKLRLINSTRPRAANTQKFLNGRDSSATLPPYHGNASLPKTKSKRVKFKGSWGQQRFNYRAALRSANRRIKNQRHTGSRDHRRAAVPGAEKDRAL